MNLINSTRKLGVPMQGCLLPLDEPLLLDTENTSWHHTVKWVLFLCCVKC